MIEQSTHFNPVEIFCSVKDYKDVKFNLDDFTQKNRSLAVSKSYNGSAIKYLEKPGLWNGGMHNWLTIFIEMDGNLFNPVKTITDLLEENHQE